MKIVFVNRFYAPDHSATSQMLTDLATALASGNEVHVVTSRQRYDDPAASLPPYEMIRGVLVDRVYTTTFGRAGLAGRSLDYLSFYIASSLRLLRLARRGDVIVAKTDPPLISVAAGWVALIRGAHLVNWLQDVFPEVAEHVGLSFLTHGLCGKLLRRLRNQSLRLAAANVVLGARMRERVAAMGVVPKRITLIPNWADGAALKPMTTSANPLREEWGLGNKLVVGYSGNLGRVHEFDTLLGSARALRARADIVFLFIGEGAQKAALVSASRDENLENLMFKPFQSRQRLRQSLGVADVHIVTLRPDLEGFVVPSKFYGVAAVGRPTIFIGDPDGEIGSVVRAADCGYCVTEGNVAGLVEAIVTLRDDPLLRARMGDNARRVFDERYDKRIAIEQWRSLLQSVASVKCGSAG